MKIHYAEILISTLTFLLIVVAIKILLFILKFLKRIVTFFLDIPTKLFKDTEWNDLDRIVLHTKTRIRVPRSQFQPNQTYYNVFMTNPHNEINTRNIMINILEHTGYEGPTPDIKYIPSGNELSKHLIYKKDEPACIYITADINFQPTDILALIIHECMHIYKIYYKLEYGDGFDQEVTADILAVYLGFYKNLSIAHKFYTCQKDLDYAYKRIHN